MIELVDGMDAVESSPLCVLCFTPRWSRPALHCIPLFERLEASITTTTPIDFFLVRSDGGTEIPGFSDWFGRTANSRPGLKSMGTGGGEIFWLRHGEVIGFELYVYARGYERLEELAAEVLASEQPS
ncbi:MAG: hypothetical protein AAF533_12920 [Acidobacteriota bacterium]